MATTITANGINFPDGSASAPSIGGTDTNTGLFTGSDIVGFATGGVERIRINANGKVCINNDTALSDLHICTAGSSEEDRTLRIGGSVISLGLTLDYDQSGATVSRITANPTYTNDDSLLKICVDGDANPNQLVLRGDGNIGIGINDTSANLQIVGSSSAGLLRVGGNQTNGVGVDISYNNSSTTTTTFKQNYRATNAAALMKFDSGHFTFHTGTSGAHAAAITSAGNFVIGHTAANNKFQIGNTGHTGYAIAANSATYGTVLQVGDGATPTTAAALWVRNLNNGGTPTTCFRVDGNGKVGCGNVTNPGAGLDVSAAYNVIGLRSGGGAINYSSAFIFRFANGDTVLEGNNARHVIPGDDAVQDLGISTKRWRNVYTTDLQLSNVGGGGNEVDGTEGTWTLQEGEDDIYMINRKTGKKYKMMLQEVS